MESVYHIKTREYFDVPEDDFDKFQNIFGKYEPRLRDFLMKKKFKKD
jgi:hypothetical protein